MSVNAIPQGFHSITPYLITKDAKQAIAYYEKAFNAQEVMKLEMPDGKVGHAELLIGNSHIMIADEFPEMDNLSPLTLDGTAVSLCFYVEDVDTVFNHAINSGATQVREVSDLFYGDRAGTLCDPFGHIWTIATHIEDVTPQEIANRMRKCFKP